MSKIEDAVKLAKILSFLEKYNIKNATINKDFTVDVNGDVYLFNINLKKIPIQFGKVEGDFSCAVNQLTSLKGAPKRVGGNFRCCDNQLTSLEGGPEWVGGSVDCNSNQLTTLEGGPTETGSFYCYDNQLTSLKGAPRKVRGYFDCSNNRLITLEGAPEYVGGTFDCLENKKLKSLKGIGKVCKKIQSDFFNGKLKDYKGEL